MARLPAADVAQATPPDAVAALVGLAALWPDAAVVGPAFPCACAPGDNLALHQALAAAPRGSVIVCAAGGDLTCAYSGDLMALDARQRGLAGLVVDGAVRDARALEEIGLPVFARGTCPLPPAKSVALSVGLTVTVAGVEVRAGDLVVGDRDGVLVVRDSTEEELARAVAAVHAREALVRRRLEDGEPLGIQLGVLPARPDQP